MYATLTLQSTQFVLVYLHFNRLIAINRLLTTCQTRKTGNLLYIPCPATKTKTKIMVLHQL